MAAYKSVQETKRTNVPPKMLAPDELKGRIRVAYFDYTVPAGGIALNDTVDLCTLPLGARLLGGRYANSAMGGTGALQIGVAGTAGKYLAATSIAAAGNGSFAADVATNVGDVMTAETTLVATVSTAGWQAGGVLRGHATYVLD